jgi:hypothetical protein
MVTIVLEYSRSGRESRGAKQALSLLYCSLNKEFRRLALPWYSSILPPTFPIFVEMCVLEYRYVCLSVHCMFGHIHIESCRNVLYNIYTGTVTPEIICTKAAAQHPSFGLPDSPTGVKCAKMLQVSTLLPPAPSLPTPSSSLGAARERPVGGGHARQLPLSRPFTWHTGTRVPLSNLNTDGGPRDQDGAFHRKMSSVGLRRREKGPFGPYSTDRLIDLGRRLFMKLHSINEFLMFKIAISPVKNR